MKSCEEHQIDLDRRAHGALDDAEGAALDAHVAECDACRGYAALARDVDAGLRAASDGAARVARWERIEARLEARARRMRRARWLVPTALLGAAAFAHAIGLPLRAALVMAAGALVVTALARRLSSRWLAALERASLGEGGLVAFSRAEVEAELRAARRGSVALVALAAAQVGVVEGLGVRRELDRALVLGGAALLVLTAVQLAFVEAPRLRREREELS